MLVYVGEDMYVHVCVCLYKNTPYNGVLVTICVCKSSQGRVNQGEDLCPCLSTILVFLANL